MQSNTINRTPSNTASGSRGPNLQSPDHSTGFSTTAHNLTRAVFQQQATKQIISKCKAIDNCSPSVPVSLRHDLSNYLVGNKVSNPGTLSDRQTDLCAWVLMEHASRTPSKTVSADQLKSFIKPEDNARFSRLACKIGVKARDFAA